MNAVTAKTLDELSQTCVLLVRGLHELTNLVPAYKNVADPLSYATAVRIIEELRLGPRTLPQDELATHTEQVTRLAVAIRQAIAEWLAERD